MNTHTFFQTKKQPTFFSTKRKKKIKNITIKKLGQRGTGRAARPIPRHPAALHDVPIFVVPFFCLVRNRAVAIFLFFLTQQIFLFFFELRCCLFFWWRHEKCPSAKQKSGGLDVDRRHGVIFVWRQRPQ